MGRNGARMAPPASGVQVVDRGPGSGPQASVQPAATTAGGIDARLNRVLEQIETVLGPHAYGKFEWQPTVALDAVGVSAHLRPGETIQVLALQITKAKGDLSLDPTSGEVSGSLGFSVQADGPKDIKGTAEMSYAGGAWAVNGTLGATLPIVGDVSAELALSAEDKSLAVEVEPTEPITFSWPRSNATGKQAGRQPARRGSGGSVGADVTLESGSIALDLQNMGLKSGSLSGTANIHVPPSINKGKDIEAEFELSAESDTFAVSGSLANSDGVEIHKYLKLETLEISYSSEDGMSFTLGAALQNISASLSKASVTIAIDRDGFRIEEGEVAADFGKFSLDVSFSYDEEDGIGFTGNITVPFRGVELSAEIEYRKEDGESLFDVTFQVGKAEAAGASSEQGARSGGSGRKSANRRRGGAAQNDNAAAPSDGLELFPGKEWKMDSLLPKMPKVSIIVFSVGVASATIEIEVNLGCKLAIEPVVLSGAVAATGINLTKGSFEEISATGILTGGFSGALIFAPAVGVGASVFHPFFFGLNAGVEIAAIAGLGIDLTAAGTLAFDSSGGITGSAAFEAPVKLTLAVEPSLFAGFEALGGLLGYEWKTPPDLFGSLTIMKDQELFSLSFDLGNPGKDPAVKSDGQATSGALAASPVENAAKEQKGKSKGGTPPKTKQLAVSKPLPDQRQAGEGKTEDGGMDFGLLLRKLREKLLPKELNDVIDTLESIWNAVKSFIDKVVKFVDWIGGQIREIVDTDEEVVALIDDVLAQLRDFNPLDVGKLFNLIKSFVGIVWTVAQKLIAKLDREGRVWVTLKEKRYAIGIDEFSPDIYNIKLKIPGILDWDADVENWLDWVGIVTGILGLPIHSKDEVRPDVEERTEWVKRVTDSRNMQTPR